MIIEERVKWVERNGHHILIQDFTDCVNTQNSLKILKLFEKEVVASNYETFNTLTIITGIKFDPNLFLEMKNIAKRVRPRLANSKRAMVGIDSATRRIMFKGMNMFAGGNPSLAFDTVEEALEYLSS